MAMSVMMVRTATQQPGTPDFYRQVQASDRDRFAEMYRYRRDAAAQRLVIDQNGDHRHDERRQCVDWP